MSTADNRWYGCTEPKELVQLAGPCLTERRQGLILCAICRLLWEQLEDPRSRAAVELAEVHYDKGHTSADTKLAQVRQDAHEARQRFAKGGLVLDKWRPAWVASMLLMEGRTDLTFREVVLEPDIYFQHPLQVCDLMRDVVPNPYRSLSLLQRSGGSCGGQGLEFLDYTSPWLTWNNGTVPRLAEAIDKDRDFSRLPILADALEEAGCSEPLLLQHCRAVCSYCKDATFECGNTGIPYGQGMGDKKLQARMQQVLGKRLNRHCICGGSRLQQHVKGCWVVDYLLGKS